MTEHETLPQTLSRDDTERRFNGDPGRVTAQPASAEAKVCLCFKGTSMDLGETLQPPPPQINKQKQKKVLHDGLELIRHI